MIKKVFFRKIICESKRSRDSKWTVIFQTGIRRLTFCKINNRPLSEIEIRPSTLTPKLELRGGSKIDDINERSKGLIVQCLCLSTLIRKMVSLVTVEIFYDRPLQTKLGKVIKIEGLRSQCGRSNIKVDVYSTIFSIHCEYFGPFSLGMIDRQLLNRLLSSMTVYFEDDRKK